MDWCLKLPRETMEWWKNTFDVIVIIIWRQEYGKENGGKIDVEIVTDGKNDKTEKNYKEYVHSKGTRDGTCVLFCVSPSFVLGVCANTGRGW